MYFGNKIQTVFKFFLFGGLFYCLLRLRTLESKHDTGKENGMDWQYLILSLNQSVDEALKVSEKINEDIERKQASAAEISSELNRKIQALQNLLAEMPAPRHPSVPVAVSSRKTEEDDKYSQVVALASKGLNSQEIARKVQIPVGEVELTLNLRK